MQQADLNNISIDKLSLPLLAEKKVEVSVLRLDKIHPLISGNKWFKLRYYLEEAKQQKKKAVITFGGAWSNHILATAAACKLHRLECTGIIRGESTYLSPTLTKAKELGMQLIFTTREDYRDKKIPLPFYTDDHYIINEGGYGRIGAEGAATILDHCNKKEYDTICCAVGTGTMIAGLINGADTQQHITGISVLKNNIELEEKIKPLVDANKTNFTIRHDYHFGGYAKSKPELIEFMNNFFIQTMIPTDFVYTGKLFFAISNLISNNFYTPGSKLLVIHSGGLQGNDSLSKGTLIF